MKTFILIVALFCLVTGFNLKAHAQSQSINDKDIGSSIPNPDRPSYDTQGNKYDYQGNPVEQAPLDSSNTGK